MRPRILYIVTHAQSAGLLDGQLGAMRRAGYHVGFVSAPGPRHDRVAEQGFESFAVPMSREISPVTDLKSLVHLIKIMRQWRPDIVNAGTPKAGFLGMMAAFIARVPARVYALRGLRLETSWGNARRILSLTERIASACAHRVLAVSGSLAERHVELGLAPEEKVRVIGSGSSNGIRTERFLNVNPLDVARFRERLGIPDETPVVGFVGRFTRDKGIVELVDAFERVRESIPKARLLLVGDFEAGDPVPDETVARIRQNESIIQAGFVSDSAPYYALMDVLAFPSYREGFPNVVLEAAAAGIPVIGFRATGTVDALMDGVTGTIVELGDSEALAEGMLRYLRDPELRGAHGESGRKRAIEDFQPERIWEGLLEEYRELLSQSR